MALIFADDFSQYSNVSELLQGVYVSGKGYITAENSRFEGSTSFWNSDSGTNNLRYVIPKNPRDAIFVCSSFYIPELTKYTNFLWTLISASGDSIIQVTVDKNIAALNVDVGSSFVGGAKPPSVGKTHPRLN